MRTIHVTGLDVSLTSTGVAVLGCTPDDAWTVHTYPVPTAPVAPAGAAPEPGLLDRMDYVVSSVAVACEHSDVVAIERPAYAAKGNAVSTMHGLWWLVYRRIARMDVPVVIVPPSSAKAYATGHGNAAKRDVSRATARMWPDVETSTGDEDDALVIASLAADMAGLPVPYPRTAYRVKALGAIARPDDLAPFS